ncbi:MAG: peptide deformylase [Pirellulaceae bacterium]|nr:peptide deformylase [Planctomycetales bacterium]
MLKIIEFPHPTLRHKSKPIKRVDSQLRSVIREMFDLMYAANGIGLAANQVNLPLRLFVANLAGKQDEGEEIVFINPVISRERGNEEREEGCLSLPGLYGFVRRSTSIRVNAFTLDGTEIDQEVSGMLARMILHETDHLDGVLFIDRLSETGEITARDTIETFKRNFEDQARRDPDLQPQNIEAHLREWEARYC